MVDKHIGMKTFIFLLTLLFLPQMILAQFSQGKIIYERTSYWSKIAQRLPYLSQEEKDRSLLTNGSKEGWKSNYILNFDSTASILKKQVKSGSESAFGYSWREEDYLIYRNFKDSKKVDWIELLGKTYLIEEDYVRPKWKILNEIKEVAGYVCMKAESVDTIKSQKIVAWFTDAIPVSSGPEQFYGLPGMILEINKNDGDVVIVATNIEFNIPNQVVKLPKLKGKKVTTPYFLDLVKAYIQESIKAQRNPYWTIDY